jgi:hypothetical protein
MTHVPPIYYNRPKATTAGTAAAAAADAGELATLRARVAALEGETARLRTEASRAVVAADTTALRAQLTTADAALDVSRRELEEARRRLASANAAAEAERKQLAEVNGRLIALTSEGALSESRAVAELNARLGALQLDASRLAAEKTRAEENLLDVENVLAEAKSNVTELSDELARANAQLAASVPRIEYDSVLRTARAEHDNLSQQLVVREAELVQAREQCAAARSEREASCALLQSRYNQLKQDNTDLSKRALVQADELLAARAALANVTNESGGQVRLLQQQIADRDRQLIVYDNTLAEERQAAAGQREAAEAARQSLDELRTGANEYVAASRSQFNRLIGRLESLQKPAVELLKIDRLLLHGADTATGELLRLPAPAEIERHDTLAIQLQNALDVVNVEDEKNKQEQAANALVLLAAGSREKQSGSSGSAASPPKRTATGGAAAAVPVTAPDEEEDEEASAAMVTDSGASASTAMARLGAVPAAAPADVRAARAATYALLLDGDPAVSALRRRLHDDGWLNAARVVRSARRAVARGDVDEDEARLWMRAAIEDVPAADGDYRQYQEFRRKVIDDLAAAPSTTRTGRAALLAAVDSPNIFAPTLRLTTAERNVDVDDSRAIDSLLIGSAVSAKDADVVDAELRRASSEYYGGSAPPSTNERITIDDLKHIGVPKQRRRALVLGRAEAERTPQKLLYDAEGQRLTDLPEHAIRSTASCYGTETVTDVVIGSAAAEARAAFIERVDAVVAALDEYEDDATETHDAAWGELDLWSSQPAVVRQLQYKDGGDAIRAQFGRIVEHDGSQIISDAEIKDVRGRVLKYGVS